MSNNGKLGEWIFQQRMIEKGYKVQDVSNNPCYWNKDIDFIVESPFTGAVKTFECKYDSKIHRTSNLYLEIENICSQGRKGWYEFCEADYLAYGDAQTNTFYIIPLLELRARVEELPTRIGRCGQESTGLLISLEDIKDIVEIL